MIFKNFCAFICSTLLIVNVKCTDFDVGSVIDLFKNYGLLINMLPVAVKNVEHFMETEFSQNVFEKNTIIHRVTYKDEQTSGRWKVNLCLDHFQLIQHFLDDFQIEMVENRPKSFASSWKIKDMEEVFGVPNYYLLNDFIFLLIRHERGVTYNSLKSIPTNYMEINSKLRALVDNITTEDTQTVFKAIEGFGSHFVHSYVVGNVIYQVLVYPKGAAKCLEKFVIHEVPGKCAVYPIIQAGRIKTYSDLHSFKPNNSTKSKANLLFTKFNDKEFFEEYQSKHLTIIGFNLTSIHTVIQNQTKSLFVKEVIDNQMKLRDLYM